MNDTYYNRADEAAIFGGRQRNIDDGFAFVLHPSDAPSDTLVTIRDTIKSAQRHRWGEDAKQAIAFVDTASVEFDEDYSTRKPYSLELVGSVGTAEVLFENSRYEDELTEAEIRGVLSPLLKRHQLLFLTSSPHLSGPPDPPWLWVLELQFQIRGRRLGALLEALDEVVALLGAFESGELNRESARDLIVGGNVGTLVGQAESSWLEAKSSLYDLTALAGKVALASAVARFANSPIGGLVVIGLRTKRTPRGETITGVTPIPVDVKQPRRVRHILQHHLFPPVEGLGVLAVETDGGQLLLIDVPPQPAELLPFLVHGAIVDGRGEGSFISIVRRSEDESIATTAPMIHSTIAAGRALLRGPRQETIRDV